MLTDEALSDRTHLLRELRAQYNDMTRADVRLVLQTKASCRRYCGGDKDEANRLFSRIENGEEEGLIVMAVAPLLAAREPLVTARKQLTKQIEKACADLPARQFVEGVKGFGLGSFGAIVGEAGDLALYSNPAKLWKRFGLAVMPDGRQRKVTGDAALLHGYRPTRRSLVWNVGDCLIKLQSGKIDEETGEVLKEPGPYRAVYDARKAYELAREDNDGMKVGHAHNRAKRYMEKRLMRDLWRAWRDDLKMPAEREAA